MKRGRRCGVGGDEGGVTLLQSFYLKTVDYYTQLSQFSSLVATFITQEKILPVASVVSMHHHVSLHGLA